MKILVTGGAGFIGTNVCLEGRARGYDMIAFDNFVRPRTEENIPVLLKAGIKIVRGDIRNEEDFEKIPKVDAIIHLAGQCGIPYAQINPRYDFEVNAHGTLNVLEYSRLHDKIPVAFASSNKSYTDIVNDIDIEETKTRYNWKFGQDSTEEDGFDWLSPFGLNEQTPLDAFGQYARSLYGTSKVAGDLYMQEYWQAFKVPTVVNRMSCIYGLYQKGVEEQAWVSWFINQIALGDGKINIFGSGKQVRDMLYGTDCARLYVDEIEELQHTNSKIAGKTYNIGGGGKNTLSLLEAIIMIEDITGQKSTLSFEAKRHGDQDIWISDLTRIKKDLGWEPFVSPEIGIKLMIEEATA